MRASRVVTGLILAAALAACGDAADKPPAAGEAPVTEQAPAATDAVPAWVGDVAAVANAIEAAPAAADSILAAHDMTRTAFDSLLYEIAAEPAYTTAYQEARR